MKRGRISIGGLSVVIAVVALGLTVAGHAADHADELLTLLLGGLITSAAVALARPGRLGAFCEGFAAAGSCYLLLWALPVGSYLPTTMLLDRLESRLGGPSDLANEQWEDGETPMQRQARTIRFRRAGHSLTALSLALLGGFAGRLLTPAEAESEARPDPYEGRLFGSADRRA